MSAATEPAKAVEPETHGEILDQPETTRDELRGFWLYNSALSATGGIGRLLSLLLLNDLARGAGIYEFTNISCTEPYVPPAPRNGTATNGTIKASITTGNAASPVEPNCVLPIAGSYLNVVSYVSFVSTLAVIVQVLLFISISSFADYGEYRRLLLIITGVVGSLSCMLLPLAYNPSLYWLAGLLVILLSIFQSVSFVFIDAYFPILVRNDPVVKYHHQHRRDTIKRRSMPVTAEPAEHPDTDAAQSVLPRDSTVSSATAADLISAGEGTHRQLSIDGYIVEKTAIKTQSYDDRANWVQKYNNIIGFSTNFMSLALGAIAIVFLGGGYLALEVIIAASGVYWLALGIVAWRKLKARPGPPIPKGVNYIVFSWLSVFKSIKKARQLPNTFIYLLAFFFYGDGMNTLGFAVVLFTRDKLKMSNFEALVVAGLFPVFAIVGSFALASMQSYFRIATKNMLIACVCGFIFVPVYALIGAFNTTFGLIYPAEAFVVTLWGGFFFGGAVSFGKVLFSELIPPGMEGEFFGLAAIADRGSSWIGALMVGVISNTWDLRFGLVSLVLLFLISIPLLFMIDVQQGFRDARLMAVGAHEDIIVLDDNHEFDAEEASDAGTLAGSNAGNTTWGSLKRSVTRSSATSIPVATATATVPRSPLSADATVHAASAPSGLSSAAATTASSPVQQPAPVLVADESPALPPRRKTTT
ncbi:vacuole effluxer Atg22 like-domain-containing protein [Entophlyctis helioformis]|nr:vacuole effluxer Atg22 like-domain-containing protein [Entophlyctis helioformis]